MIFRIIFFFLFISQGLSCAGLAKSPIDGDIRIVIGASSTGDTYQSSTIVARAMEEKLGVKVTVEAPGLTEAFTAIDKAGDDGKTLMIFNDQAYLNFLYGVKGLKDLIGNYRIGPLLAINPGIAYLVPKSTPYASIQDVIDACGAGTQVRMAVSPGSVSEVGYTALQHAIKVKYPGREGNLIRVVSAGAQKEKNKQLFEGKADLISGSVQINEEFTKLPVYDRRAMRFVWLTSRAEMMQRANPDGFGKTSRDELMKNMEPYIWIPYDRKTNFTFDKEYFFIYNKNISNEIVAYLDKVLADIYSEGKIQEMQKKSFFIPNFSPSSDAEIYLKNKRDFMETIINGLH